MTWIRVISCILLNSVRWHCTILMKTTGLNEDSDRAVRGVVYVGGDQGGRGGGGGGGGGRPPCIKIGNRASGLPAMY